MSKIQEVLFIEQYGSKHYYLIVDEYPDFKYERRGNLVFSNVDGFTSSYVINRGTKNAFGGREFDIPMEDGTKLHADGSIWSSGQSEAAGVQVTSVGVATREMLKKCYVFVGEYIDSRLLEEWLKQNPNKTHGDYSKYDPRRPLKHKAPTDKDGSMRTQDLSEASTSQPEPRKEQG